MELPARPTYRLETPAEHVIPEGQEHIGFYYKQLNRRTTIVLRPDGLADVITRRLLTRDELASIVAEGAADLLLRWRQGRVMYTRITLPVGALSCFTHFVGHIAVTGPQREGNVGCLTIDRPVL